MIVRDEAGVVTETLDSIAPFIDYWVIVDTGSLDDTIELIRSYFVRREIPGELHERPWRNFGANRTEALELAAGKADYTFVMDADDLLVGTPDLSELGADSYQLRFGTESVWWRRQLFRSALPWRYEGVVHEYPTCEEARTEERLGGEYHIVPRHLGARSEDPEKYARDAELLLEEHARKPDDTRTVFYLAQSYFSAGDPGRALPWYELRARMGEFAEEVYFSLLRRALCLKQLGRPIADVAQAFLDAWESRPARAEALCELATAYRGAEKFDLAYLYAKHASEIEFPDGDMLFLDASVYTWRSLDERAIAAYYLGRFQESYDICRDLLASDVLPERERERMRSNQAFAESRLRTDRVRVKLLGNFAGSAEICAQWDRQSEGNGRWRDIEVVPDGDADYFAVVNFPRDARDEIDPARTIVFQMEPWEVVSQWGEWAQPDPQTFAQVRSHDRFPNNAEWYLGLTHAELKTRPIEKTKTLSTVTSGRYALPGQKLRVDFIRHLEAEGTEIDVYGWNSTPLTPHKDDGLLPYRYTFAAENTSEHNYFTEKVVDAILAECLCFYWGCPNLEEHLGEDAFVRLPLEDFARSREIIERSIRDGEWERRLPAIREAKRRLLDDLQFFPTLARSVGGHRLAEALSIRVINLDRRPDRWEAFEKRALRVAGERFLERCERVSAVDGSMLAPSAELDHLFRDNTFGLRRGVVGCALSHLSIWREVAEGNAPGCLVFEDDARVADGFTGQLVELCGRLLELDEPFDMAILGYEHWSTENELDRHDAARPPRVAPMAWENYLGIVRVHRLARRSAQARRTRRARRDPGSDRRLLLEQVRRAAHRRVGPTRRLRAGRIHVRERRHDRHPVRLRVDRIGERTRVARLARLGERTVADLAHARRGRAQDVRAEPADRRGDARRRSALAALEPDGRVGRARHPHARPLVQRREHAELRRAARRVARARRSEPARSRRRLRGLPAHSNERQLARIRNPRR